jgi:hypothetical protein
MLLLVDLLHYTKGNAMLFSNPIGLLPIVYKVCIGSLLAIKIAKLTDSLRKGNASTLLLK